MTPIYRADNCTPAYQLNWSVSLFGRVKVPPKEDWIDALMAATEKDGVRILEVHESQSDVAQFFVSTRPDVSPSEIIRSIKGRWQYLIQGEFPSAFQRNYSITSVGEETSETLQRYVDGQVLRHQMADKRVNQKLAAMQFHDPAIDLDTPQIGNYGRYVYSLQIVIENAGGWNDIREDVLFDTRSMIIRSAATKGWRLSRIGLLSNHIHLLLGCHVTDSPEGVTLSFLNNLSYVQGMRPVFRFSYYAGTFGTYNRNAIRRRIDGR